MPFPLTRVLPLLAALTLALAPAARAQGTDCPQNFVDGVPPVLTNPRLAPQTVPLCFRAYAVLHSGLTRTPLWSAERLTRARIRAARQVARVNDFHPEPRLPPEQRAELEDYARSGYDRGHMSPSGDMPDADSQQESFSLANMVPQAPALNRGLWEGIESAVRRLATRDGTVYVVTGPIFQGSSLKALNGRVLVPTGIYKAIYDARRRQAGAYVVRNTNDSEWQPVSVARLQQIAGIDVFPSLPADVKAAAIALPRPTPHNHAPHAGGRRHRPEGPLDWLFR